MTTALRSPASRILLEHFLGTHSLLDHLALSRRVLGAAANYAPGAVDAADAGTPGGGQACRHA